MADQQYSPDTVESSTAEDFSVLQTTELPPLTISISSLGRVLVKYPKQRALRLLYRLKLPSPGFLVENDVVEGHRMRNQSLRGM